MTLIDIERPAVTDDDGAAPAPANAPTPAPERAAAVPRPRPERRRLFADLAGPLSRRWGVALVGAWVVVVAVGLAVEPPPANPDAVPLVANLMSTALMGTWGAMAAGIFQGRRFAAAASLAGGGLLLALTLGCPLSGHHHGIGAWWGIQLVGAAALLALSRRALRSSAR